MEHYEIQKLCISDLTINNHRTQKLVFGCNLKVHFANLLIGSDYFAENFQARE